MTLPTNRNSAICEWLIDVINSCNTPEQLHSTERLITAFRTQLVAQHATKDLSHMVYTVYKAYDIKVHQMKNI